MKEFENLNELKNLRDKTRKTVASKIIAICNYAEENGFSKILSLQYLSYVVAPLEDPVTKLVIESDKKDDFDYCVPYPIPNEMTAEELANEIVCNNERTDVVDESYCCKGAYRHPSINQCKAWCDRKIQRLAELQEKEIKELKALLKELEE